MSWLPRCQLPLTRKLLISQQVRRKPHHPSLFTLSSTMDELPDFFTGELPDFHNDELPIFIPVEASQALSDSEMKHLFQSTNPKIAAAEAECEAGDLFHALISIDQLVQDGTPAQDLQICLLEATGSGNVPLVQRLLSFDVPVSIGAVSSAVCQGSLDLLSLFLKYGWDVNKEVEWCFPPPLS